MGFLSLLRRIFLAIIGHVEVRHERVREPRPAPLRAPVPAIPPVYMGEPVNDHYPLIVDGIGCFVRLSYDQTAALQERANALLVLRAIGSIGCCPRQEEPCELN